MLLNRLELRLGDPMDSEFDRKVARERPGGRAGPRSDPGEAALHDGAAADRRLLGAGGPAGGHAEPRPRRSTPLARARPPRAYGCCRASSCRPTSCPKGFEYPERGVAIGIDETDLEPVFVDFETDPFFIVFGESESGKTALLRLLIKQITERYTPDEAKIVSVDYRRALLGVVPETHLLEYAADGDRPDGDAWRR